MSMKFRFLIRLFVATKVNWCRFSHSYRFVSSSGEESMFWTFW